MFKLIAVVSATLLLIAGPAVLAQLTDASDGLLDDAVATTESEEINLETVKPQDDFLFVVNASTTRANTTSTVLPDAAMTHDEMATTQQSRSVNISTDADNYVDAEGGHTLETTTDNVSNLTNSGENSIVNNSSDCNRNRSSTSDWTRVAQFTSTLIWSCGCLTANTMDMNNSSSTACSNFYAHVKNGTRVQLEPMVQAICALHEYRELFAKMLIVKLLIITVVAVLVFIMVKFVVGKKCMRRSRSRKSDSYWLDGPVSLEWDPAAEPTACRVWHINERKDSVSCSSTGFK